MVEQREDDRTIAQYENQQEGWFASDNPAARAFASMADAAMAGGPAADSAPVEDVAVEFDAEGLREASPINTEWSMYLRAVYVNDGRTPGERLSAYFA